jgi:hypothetical protein
MAKPVPAQLCRISNVGNAIAEDEQINQTLCMMMKVTLQHIHNAGFVHGNITHCNFVGQEAATFSWWTWRDANYLGTHLSWTMK